jgi:hypothetical protein
LDVSSRWLENLEVIRCKDIYGKRFSLFEEIFFRIYSFVGGQVATFLPLPLPLPFVPSEKTETACDQERMSTSRWPPHTPSPWEDQKVNSTKKTDKKLFVFVPQYIWIFVSFFRKLRVAAGCGSE